jgi:hypothetical protein
MDDFNLQIDGSVGNRKERWVLQKPVPKNQTKRRACFHFCTCRLDPFMHRATRQEHPMLLSSSFNHKPLNIYLYLRGLYSVISLLYVPLKLMTLVRKIFIFWVNYKLPCVFKKIYMSSRMILKYLYMSRPIPSRCDLSSNSQLSINASHLCFLSV